MQPKGHPNILVRISSLALLLIAACSGMYSTQSNRWNLAAIYNPASSSFHPSYAVYHYSDNESLLLVKLFPSELLFNQANPNGEFLAQVSLEVQNYLMDGKKPFLVDSSKINYTLNQENVGRRFLAQVPFKADTGKNYQIRVIARDLLRKDFNLQFININKKSLYSSQNFSLTSAQDIPVFNNIITPGTAYKIKHRTPGYSWLYVDYYHPEISIPNANYPTPGDEKAFTTPDSSYIIAYHPDLLISFSYQGLYRFRFDTASDLGLYVSNFGQEFPKIKSPWELIPPLAYLATDKEYQDLLGSDNPKLAVDNFWLKLGETTGRSKELIRIYYNRIYFTNYYFSGSKPGWQTDRGMIYVIYGPPHNMEKTAQNETWIYYLPGSTNSLRFTFDYTPTPYELDCYTLNHAESQNWHWREAYDAWRSGHIFLQD